MSRSVRVSIPSGAGLVHVTLPEENLAGVFLPEAVPVCEDVRAEAERALAEPLGTPDLRDMVRAGDQVVILVDDHTRSTPAAEILPAVLARLAEAGVRDANITILITHGTHRLSTDEEVRRKVGPGVSERFRVVQHCCTDEANQVYVGLTSRGTPVWVNRLVVEADRRIGIGHIGPSPYAGYSGGGKLIVPGAASLDTINANHSLVALGVGRPGRVDVPCRLDIDEAAALVGLDLVLDVVLDGSERVVRAFAGAPERVYEEGVALARRIYEVPCPGPVDIAVASGFPYELDLYQAERAVEYAEVAVRPGGSVVLVAACPDGVGGEEFFRLLADPGKTPDAFLRDVVRRNGRVTFGVLGYLVARIRAEKRLCLLSEGIPRDQAMAMGFHPLDRLQAGIDALLDEYGPCARVAVFPAGAVTIPVLG